MQDNLSPVPIRWIAIATKPGEVAILNSVADLGTTLLARWPDDQRGDLWRGAVSACLRALDAQINGNAAREAFILAARDAHVSLILDQALLDPLSPTKTH